MGGHPVPMLFQPVNRLDQTEVALESNLADARKPSWGHSLMAAPCLSKLAARKLG